MGLFQKHGIYYISLTVDGKRIQRSLHTKSKALAQECWSLFLKERFLGSELMSLIKRPSMPLEAPEKQDLNGMGQKFGSRFKEYIDFCIREGQNKVTIGSKHWTLKTLSERGLNTYADLHSPKFDAFWKFCKERFQPDTTRKFSAYLKAFLNYAVKKGWYPRTELERLMFPKLKTKVRETVLSDEDWKRIEEYLKGKDDEFLLYLSILFYAGLRPVSEAFLLSQKDIDYNSGAVRIYQSKTKNYKTVFFPPAILEQCKAVPHEQLFARPRRSDTYFTHKFSKLKQTLGLDNKLVLYCLRHSFASNLMIKTGNIHLVAKQLGHSGIALAHSTYVHLGEKDIKSQVELLWGGDPKPAE